MSNKIEASASVYYKWLENQIDYVPGSDIIFNRYVEGDILQGEGRAYGLELYVEKKQDKINGWISYTLSKSERLTETINNNEWYASRFDQTHNFKIALFYKPNKVWTFSSTFTYLTGAPISLPNSLVDIYPQYLDIQDNSGNTRR